MQASSNPDGASPLSRLRAPAFQALRHRNFRMLWASLAVSAVGTWMQIVAQSLMVIDLTNGSAVALATVSLAQALAFLLFAPLGGVTADRFEKRRLLLLTQSTLMALAILLGVLTATGAVRFWMIPLLAFASGAVLSFDQPARNALISSLVPKENLMNAVALQSAVFNGASIVGPALAALALSKLGYSWSFFLNAASFLAVLAALLLLPASAARETSKPAGNLLDSAREALQFVRRDAVLPSVVAIYGALLFFGPSAALALPLFARQVLRAGPTQLGLLFSAIGAGTVLGALFIAFLGDFPHKTRLVFGSVTVWAAALAVFGFSQSLSISLSALLLLGAAQNAAGATTITLLQTRVPARMRGRAMSLNTLLIMCVRPLGDFPAGAVIARLGLRPALLLGATLVGATLLLVLAARPAARNT